MPVNSYASNLVSGQIAPDLQNSFIPHGQSTCFKLPFSEVKRATFRVSSELLDRACSATIISTTNSVSSGNGCPLYSLSLLCDTASDQGTWADEGSIDTHTSAVAPRKRACRAQMASSVQLRHAVQPGATLQRTRCTCTDSCGENTRGVRRGGVGAPVAAPEGPVPGQLQVRAVVRASRPQLEADLALRSRGELALPDCHYQRTHNRCDHPCSRVSSPGMLSHRALGQHCPLGAKQRILTAMEHYSTTSGA